MACVLSKQPMLSCVLRTADIRRGKIKNSHILEKSELDQGIRDGMEKKLRRLRFIRSCQQQQECILSREAKPGLKHTRWQVYLQQTWDEWVESIFMFTWAEFLSFQPAIPDQMFLENNRNVSEKSLFHHQYVYEKKFKLPLIQRKLKQEKFKVSF